MAQLMGREAASTAFATLMEPYGVCARVLWFDTYGVDVSEWGCQAYAYHRHDMTWWYNMSPMLLLPQLDGDDTVQTFKLAHRTTTGSVCEDATFQCAAPDTKQVLLAHCKLFSRRTMTTAVTGLLYVVRTSRVTRVHMMIDTTLANYRVHVQYARQCHIYKTLWQHEMIAMAEPYNTVYMSPRRRVDMSLPHVYAKDLNLGARPHHMRNI
ncbi:hypothetical protein [Infectious spleen and kidney necrosis virus]|uniref:ORF100 n=1 Tax=Red sea bream iridovirus TaxID=65424 RepID=A0A6G9KP89_RSIV|nr:ORF100 [Red seabream iridovirus]UWH19254.1 hypothetical protein [Infectious spleen and kidney necrosis virus]